MATKIIKYTLDDINKIIFDGFDYTLPKEVFDKISHLSSQVGSPDYIKTPVFKKKEEKQTGQQTGQQGGQDKKQPYKRNISSQKNEGKEESWERIQNNSQPIHFQTTKIEEKVGIDAEIVIIRTYLNKLTDKNYIDMCNKIILVFDKLIEERIVKEDMVRVSSTIFEIASTNRFYSKLYADLYSELSIKYEIMKDIFEKNLENFTNLFTIIEYVDPKVNYDKFCEINKINEKRKALASFYLNLMYNGIISKSQIMNITRNLLSQIYTFISIEDKKNEVDELTETIAILYDKKIYENDCGNTYEKIDGLTIQQVINNISKSKVKEYKSLTNKALFKFMDLVGL